MRALFQWLDRVVIKASAKSVPPGTGVCSDPDRINAVLDDPLLLCPPWAPPQNLRFTSECDFEFASPLPSPWPVNNTVRGRLYKSSAAWHTRPTVLLLHGWNADLCYQREFPYIAWRLNRHGINAAMFEIPFHGSRRPPRSSGRYNFITPELLDMIEATRQTIAEAKAFAHWLALQNVPSIGLWGFSLGAWISGLILGTQDHPFSSAVLLTPVSDMDRGVRELEFCAPIRQSLHGAGVRLGPLNLASFKPSIPPENILIVAGLHDLFAPKETVETLCAAWGHPPIHWHRHGHISILGSPRVLEKTVRWIRNRSMFRSALEQSC